MATPLVAVLTCTFPMIRKNLLFCKIIRIKTSSKSLFDSYMEHFKPERETCPICGSTGNCHIHHYYGRSIIDFKAGRQEKSDLCVLRVFCDSCKHAHAISKTLYIVCLFYKFHLFFRKSRFFSDILATLNLLKMTGVLPAIWWNRVFRPSQILFHCF